jgi:RHS repeat-associated protein
VQETQYDPVGLELAGLAAPSPGIRGLNNYRFNGKEFQTDLGLNWNHQDWRFLDPTILRWNGVDPEVENGQESWSPYSFGFDNAVRFADANGRVPDGPPGSLLSSIKSYLAAPADHKTVLAYSLALGHPIGDSRGSVLLAAFGLFARNNSDGAPIGGQQRSGYAMGMAKASAAASEAAAASHSETGALDHNITVAKFGNSHAMIGIDDHGQTQWFHQTYGKDDPNKRPPGVGQIRVGLGEFKREPGLPRFSKTVQVPVTKEQAFNALQQAYDMTGKNVYNPATNSCVTCAQQVLRAGGIETPALTFTPERLYNYLQNASKKK